METRNPNGSKPILGAADHQHLAEHGYLVVHNAVPPHQLQAVVDAVWSFLGMDPDRPDDWYRPPLRPGGMIEMYQHQALWDNRQHPRIYQIFREILGTGRLWVSEDRASLKPPRHPDHPEYDHPGFIHWDVDTSRRPVSFGVQAVLSLTDTEMDQGGFQCVPGLFHHFEEWLQSQPPDRDPRRPGPTPYPVVPIPTRAGDLVIWHRMLAHGNGRNLSQKPRLAQYITMFPAREEDEEQRQRRIRNWQERRGPGGSAFPGDPREVEARENPSAELTPLGRRLLGLDLWPTEIA